MFDCDACSASVEHFAFTLTDISGQFRFGFCRLSPGFQRCLCIVRSVAVIQCAVLVFLNVLLLQWSLASEWHI